MTTKKLETIDKSGIAKIALETGYSENSVLVLKRMVAKDTSDTELMYFLSVAKSVGLNPFNKEIWCYKDGKNNVIIFTGRDGLLKMAQSNPTYGGIRSAEVRKNDEFEIDIANGRIHHKVVTLSSADRGDIIGAYAIVFRKEGESTIEMADFARYNKPYGVWKTHPEEMIKKVAESHALKKAFGLSGLQIEDDFEIKGEKVLPLPVEAKSLKVMNDEDFTLFIGNSNEFIKRHKDSYEFTEKQLEQLAVRFNENE